MFLDGGTVADRYVRGAAVQDQFDISLEDSELLREVELTTDVIIAATESNAPLSASEIDDILGIAPVVER
jgi:hypothetical protein